MKNETFNLNVWLSTYSENLPVKKKEKKTKWHWIHVHIEIQSYSNLKNVLLFGNIFMERSVQIFL